MSQHELVEPDDVSHTDFPALCAECRRFLGRDNIWRAHQAKHAERVGIAPIAEAGGAA